MSFIVLLFIFCTVYFIFYFFIKRLATLKKSVEIKIKFLISKLYFLVYIAEFFFWIYLYFAAIKYGLIVEEEFVLWRDRAPVI
jgi:hypothetical protein